MHDIPGSSPPGSTEDPRGRALVVIAGGGAGALGCAAVGLAPCAAVGGTVLFSQSSQAKPIDIPRPPLTGWSIDFVSSAKADIVQPLPSGEGAMATLGGTPPTAAPSAAEQIARYGDSSG